jgi:hypothetical protein
VDYERKEAEMVYYLIMFGVVFAASVIVSSIIFDGLPEIDIIILFVFSLVWPITMCGLVLAGFLKGTCYLSNHFFGDG